MPVLQLKLGYYKFSCGSQKDKNIEPDARREEKKRVCRREANDEGTDGREREREGEESGDLGV